jgi:hypothetical protein
MGQDKYQLKAYIASIAFTNYYNDVHKIIRIEFNKRWFDFKCITEIEVPNPIKHVVMIITYDEYLNQTNSISEERTNYLPGIKNKEGELDDLPFGIAFLIPKKQTVVRTNPNSGGAGMTISNTNMFDLDKVAIAIAPSLNKDYTNNDENPDREHKNIGIFINNDGTILIKSKGSSITMGEEGIYIGGDVAWESSEHQREWMMDNTFQRFIPSTIVTFPISMPELPNIAKFAQIANGARKVRSIVKTVNSVSKLVGH